MRQDINFYRYTPPTLLEQVLVLPIVLGIAAGLAVLVLLTQVWAWQVRQEDLRRLATAQKAEQQVMAEVDQLAKQLEAQTTPPEPTQATAQADSTRLLTELKALPGHHHGFVSRLLALAQAHGASLWLQHIEMANGPRPALTLSGQSREPAPLADYTARLAAQPALAATRLYQLAGQAEVGQTTMTFTLSNQPLATTSKTNESPAATPEAKP